MHHSQFDDVGRCALNRCIAGHALPAGTNLEVGTGQFGQWAAASEQSGNVSGFFGLGNAVLHIAIHLGKGVEVSFEESLSLFDRDVQVPAEGKRPFAVHDTKIDGFGGSAQIVGYLLRGDAVNLGSSGAMNVGAGLEGVLHGFIAGDVRQNPQFDLRIVGIHQIAAVGSNEETAQTAAQLGADGNILQIGLGGADASGAGLGLNKGGVNAAIRTDGFEQSLHVGGVELLIRAILENVVNDRAIWTQTFQGFRIGGIAALGLFSRREPQFLEEGFPQLFGAVQIEGIPDLVVNAFQKLLQRGGQLDTESADSVGIHSKADSLHVCQDPCQRKFDLIMQTQHTLLLQMRVQGFTKRAENGGVRILFAGEGGGNAIFCREGGNLIPAGGRIQKISGQLAVKVQ